MLQDAYETSVIMSVYNMTGNVKELELSINSILNQTYKNFEFIICDDGSSDNTYQILETYAARDKRIILIKNNKNMGLAYALNKCIDVAKGEYIARMDGDDISLNNRLMKEIDFLKKHSEYALVGTGVWYIFGENIVGEKNLKKLPEKEDLLYGPLFFHPTICIRKKALLSVEKYTVAPYTWRCEDYDLYMKLYAVGLKGYNLPEILFKYRVEYKKKYLKLNFRLKEIKVRYIGFKKMGCLPKGIFHILKPIVSWIMPIKVLDLHKGINRKGIKNAGED